MPAALFFCLQEYRHFDGNNLSSREFLFGYNSQPTARDFICEDCHEIGSDYGYKQGDRV